MSGRITRNRRKPGDPDNRTSRLVTLRVTYDFDPTTSQNVRRAAVLSELFRALEHGARKGQGSPVHLIRAAPAYDFNPLDTYTVEF